MIEASPSKDSAKGAFLVAAGIFLSRIAGLVRERIFAHYFGNSDAADVFKAALRIPNFLQNLFGEGVLSASFIPVYAKLRASGKQDDARKVALSVGAILTIFVVILVLAGLELSNIMVKIVAPGFEGQKRDVAIQLVKLFFPGAGLLVLSAWCLGIQNSHKKFFLSYAAPVVWNLAIIISILYGSISNSGYNLAIYVGWGVVFGSLMQLLIQLPTTLFLLQNFGFSLLKIHKSVITVYKNFLPVLFGRGVVQISAYVDSMIASLLSSGAVSGLSYAQTIYLLPISLFGMAISASELPALSSIVGSESEIKVQLLTKINKALRRMSFFVIPCSIAFIFIGDQIVRILFKSGAFSEIDVIYVWAILAGSSVGLVAATKGRLLASVLYAMQDTKTPVKFACIRVFFTIIFGILCGLYLPKYLGLDIRWGAVGLTSSAGFAGWIEYLMLINLCKYRIGRIEFGFRQELPSIISSLLAGFIAIQISYFLDSSLLISAGLSCLIFSLFYLGLMKISKRFKTE